jgi:hypothetical protein
VLQNATLFDPSEPAFPVTIPTCTNEMLIMPVRPDTMAFEEEEEGTCQSSSISVVESASRVELEPVQLDPRRNA